jgi:hypothetical protein
MEGNDEHLDIFQDLDTSILDVLRRTAMRDLVEDGNHDHTQMPIEELDRLIVERLQDHLVQQRREYHLLWIFGVFPFPVINYRTIWQRHRPPSFIRLAVSFLSTVFMTILKVARTILFLVGTISYFHSLLRCFTMFGEIVTFSDNIFRDLLTFMFRNSTGLVTRHKIIGVNGGNCLYFATDDTSTWTLLTSTMYNVVAKGIKARCHLARSCKPIAATNTFEYLLFKQSPSLDLLECTIVSNTLPFRFANVFTTFFPYLSLPSYSWLLTVCVVSVYLAYAVLGDIVCVNVLFFAYYNIGKLIISYKDVYIGVSKIVWKTFGGLVG